MQARKLLPLLAFLVLVMPMTTATDTDRHVFIIGLDGASHETIQQCLEDGDLPHLKELIRDGGDLVPMEAPLPPLTPVAMSSFLTGKDPGGHGVYGFEQLDELEYDTTTVNANNLDRLLMNHTPGQSVLINVPMTYPAPEINGVVVSGFPGSSSGQYTHPPQIRQELEQMNYTVTTAGSYSDQESLEEDVFRALDQRTNISLEYMERYDWSLFMTMFTGDARLQHFQRYEDCEGALQRYYEQVDAFLGEAQERMPPNTTVLVMSNHGFEPLRKKVYLYSVLKDGGFLTPDWSLYARHFIQELGATLLDAIGLAEDSGELSGKTTFSSAYLDEIDWSQTQAFTGSYYNGQIFLNVRGQEPAGTVPPDRYEEVRAEIVDYLEGLKDPATGKPLFKEVYTRDELYSGEEIEKLPDIIVKAPGINHIARFGFWKTVLEDPVEASTPTQTGFLAGDVEFTAERPTIVDLSTTVAALLGSEYGEGKVITATGDNSTA